MSSPVNTKFVSGRLQDFYNTVAAEQVRQTRRAPDQSTTLTCGILSKSEDDSMTLQTVDYLASLRLALI